MDNENYIFDDPTPDVDFHRLVKGELHVHLNGLISSSLIRRLIQREKIDIPAGIDLVEDLNHLAPCGSLQKYLSPWKIFNLLPNRREVLTEMIDNAFLNLTADNIAFVEIRNSVLYISANLGVSVEQTLAWLIEDIEKMQEKYGIRAGVIMSVTRGPNVKRDLNNLLIAYETLKCPSSVVGLDLAGDENIAVDKAVGRLFRNARDKYGLGITIHAGETGNVSNVVEAVELFDANRIGHGIAASQNPAVMKRLSEKNVCLELCLISNSLTQPVLNTSMSPLKILVDHQVPLVLCSDNPAIHLRGLSEDYKEAFVQIKDMDLIQEMYSRQREYSFIGEL